MAQAQYLRVAGTFVLDGRMVRNADVRLLRDNVVIYQGKIVSLRRFKEDVTEVKSGYECGLAIGNFSDVKVGDIIEAFNARTTLQRDNERAARFAAEHGKLVSAGSDAHTPGEIGLAYVEMPDFEGPEEFLAALAKGRIVGRRASPLVHAVSTLAKVRRRLGWRPKPTTDAVA